MMIDCKKMHSKCQAQCCGVVPLPLDLYRKHIENIVRQPWDHIHPDGKTVMPITEDNYCVFLNADLSCNIYDDRPDICRKFGDESHPMLCCPVMNKDGNERSRQDKRRIERQTNNYINKLRVLNE